MFNNQNFFKVTLTSSGNLEKLAFSTLPPQQSISNATLLQQAAFGQTKNKSSLHLQIQNTQYTSYWGRAN
jgi:hypothetical protein